MVKLKKSGQNIAYQGPRKAISICKILVFSFCLLASRTAFAQKPNKVQQAIDAIKAANYNQDNDYITDGQRVVWVKSYKKWTPEDLVFMKKEDPTTLKFLGQAIQRQRFDVLEQLLPDYYRAHGGIKAFAADILRYQAEQTNARKS
jgi:hypothetical protein